MYEENGERFEAVLQEEGVPYTFVWNKGRVRENYKLIDGRAMLTEINDVGGEVTEGKLQEVLSTVQTLSKDSEVVVLSGGLPRGTKESFYGDLAGAVSPNALKIVDAAGERMFHALEKGADLVKPNLPTQVCKMSMHFYHNQKMHVLANY